MSATKIDPILLSVYARTFKSITDEMSISMEQTTRSPILSWGSVGHIVNCDDNYGEGIANYLYNVAPDQYQHVFICYETPASPALMQLAGQLNGRLFHFQSETKIEEIPVC